MNIVNGLRRWSALIVAGALMMTAPLTLAEAAHGGGGRGGGHGGFGGGGRGGFTHGGSFGRGGFDHGFRGHSFHGGFHGSVVIGLGGWWWNPWWYGPYWPYEPYTWGAPGYYGYGYPGYPYEGYDPGYAYPPAAPPVGYEYGEETFQGPPPLTPPQAPSPTSQAPPPVSSQLPTAYAPVTASLQIEVTPVEAEILVDGILVERAKESKGPVTVPVADGVHIVELRVGGATTMENIVVSPQTTVLIKRNLVTAGTPQQ